MQIESLDASSRASPHFVAERDHHRREVETLHQARRHDADDARAPVAIGQDQCARPTLELLPGLGLCRRERRAILRLPVAVGRVELLGDGHGLRAVFAEQQAHGVAGATHSPGGVDPWCEPEHDVRRRQPVLADARHVHQRSESRSR